MAWNAAPNGADAGLAGSVEGGLAVDPAAFPTLGDRMPQAGEPRDLRLLSDIELELCVEIGRADCRCASCWPSPPAP